MYKIYKWFEAFHVVFVISWMAGMLYLPRIFVYHCGVEKGCETDKKFMQMEYRLLNFIMMPAALGALLTGSTLMWIKNAYLFPWFHIKLLFIFFMLLCHWYLIKLRNLFSEETGKIPARNLKIFNELITVCMVVIVFMVILKPFR